MRPDIEGVFAEFDESLRVPAEERRRLTEVRDSVAAELGSVASITRLVDVGSFQHGTEVRGYSRFDSLVVFSAKPTSLARAVELVTESLPEGLLAARQSPAGDSVLIDQPDSPGLRLIPAFEQRRAAPLSLADSAGEIVLLPDAARRWVAVRPGARQRLIDRLDEGSLRASIRLLLAWKYRTGLGVSSYYLETAAVRQTLDQPSFSPLWDICWLFERLALDDLAALPDLSSPDQAGRVRAAPTLARRIEAQYLVDRGANAARAAVNAYIDENFDAVGAHLRSVFGATFTG